MNTANLIKTTLDQNSPGANARKDGNDSLLVEEATTTTIQEIPRQVVCAKRLGPNVPSNPMGTP